MSVDFNNLVDDDTTNTVGTMMDKAELQGLLMGAVVARTDTGAVNNWAPGLAGHTVITWAGASDATISGITGGVSGQYVVVRNIGTFVAYFLHQSGLSSASNKFTNTVSTISTPVAPGGAVVFRYNGTTWYLVAHEQGAWISYTPTWANFGTANSLGNGSLSGGYRVSGATLQFRVTLGFGSTTASGNGVWNFTFPFSVSGNSIGMPFPAYVFDASAGAYMAVGKYFSATQFVVYESSATFSGGISGVAPMTWTTSDALYVSGKVEL